MAGLSKVQAALLGGLVAGTMDIGAASLINVLSPVFISQFIAGGLLGKASLAGGMQTAALGVALQWAMSIVIAAIYVFASTRLAALRRQLAAVGNSLRHPGLFRDDLCRGAAVGLASRGAVHALWLRARTWPR